MGSIFSFSAFFWVYSFSFFPPWDFVAWEEGEFLWLWHSFFCDCYTLRATAVLFLFSTKWNLKKKYNWDSKAHHITTGQIISENDTIPYIGLLVCCYLHIFIADLIIDILKHVEKYWQLIKQVLLTLQCLSHTNNSPSRKYN